MMTNDTSTSFSLQINGRTQALEASWIDEDEQHLGPFGTKGIGEIGIVGMAAAIANAVHHAPGLRVRDLPIRPDKVLPGLHTVHSTQANAMRGF